MCTAAEQNAYEPHCGWGARRRQLWCRAGKQPGRRGAEALSAPVLAVNPSPFPMLHTLPRPRPRRRPAPGTARGWPTTTR